MAEFDPSRPFKAVEFNPNKPFKAADEAPARATDEATAPASQPAKESAPITHDEFATLVAHAKLNPDSPISQRILAADAKRNANPGATMARKVLDFTGTPAWMDKERAAKAAGTLSDANMHAGDVGTLGWADEAMGKLSPGDSAANTQGYRELLKRRGAAFADEHPVMSAASALAGGVPAAMAGPGYAGAMATGALAGLGNSEDKTAGDAAIGAGLGAAGQFVGTQVPKLAMKAAGRVMQGAGKVAQMPEQVGNYMERLKSDPKAGLQELADLFRRKPMAPQEAYAAKAAYGGPAPAAPPTGPMPAPSMGPVHGPMPGVQYGPVRPQVNIPDANMNLAEHPELERQLIDSTNEMARMSLHGTSELQGRTDPSEAARQRAHDILEGMVNNGQLKRSKSVGYMSPDQSTSVGLAGGNTAATKKLEALTGNTAVTKNLRPPGTVSQITPPTRVDTDPRGMAPPMRETDNMWDADTAMRLKSKLASEIPTPQPPSGPFPPPGPQLVDNWQAVNAAKSPSQRAMAKFDNANESMDWGRLNKLWDERGNPKVAAEVPANVGARMKFGTKKDAWNSIKDASGVDDYDARRGDQLYELWKARRGPKPPPFKDGHFDEINRIVGKKVSGGAEAFDLLTKGEKNWDEVNTAIRHLREVPGLENLRMPDHATESIVNRGAANSERQAIIDAQMQNPEALAAFGVDPRAKERGFGTMDMLTGMLGLKVAPAAASIAGHAGRYIEKAGAEMASPEAITKSWLANPSLLAPLANQPGNMGAGARFVLDGMKSGGQDGLKARLFILQSQPWFRAMTARQQEDNGAQDYSSAR